MLFSGGTAFITLSYLSSAVLILGLIGQTIWRAQSTKRQVEDLERQYAGLQNSDETERS